MDGLFSSLFETVIGLFAYDLNETGGGGMIRLLNMHSDGIDIDVDGELIGDISLGDKESMLSTPLSASDIAAAFFAPCGEEEEVLLYPIVLLQDPEVEGYGGGGSIVEDKRKGCCGDKGTEQVLSSFSNAED